MNTPERIDRAVELPARPDPQSSRELRVGTYIHYGKYRVADVLGRGSFAIVYAAEHVALRRPVAIKVVHVTAETGRGLIARFQREAQTAALVRHPNVLETYDSGTLPDGSPFLVLERVDGGTLTSVLARGPLSIVTAIDLGRQLARGLAAIAEAGIVHRDLKPDNVMLHRTPDGATVVKIVDFGVSKSILSKGVGLTAQGELVGTPQYMSPEQLRGEEIDARADVYALGALLYEAVTGHVPHKRENLGDLMVAVLNESFGSPRSLRPDCPEGLERILLKALERDRKQRFESPSAMLEALDHLAWEHASQRVPALQQQHPPVAESSVLESVRSPGDDLLDSQTRRTSTNKQWQRRVVAGLAITAAASLVALAIMTAVLPERRAAPDETAEAAERTGTATGSAAGELPQPTSPATAEAPPSSATLGTRPASAQPTRSGNPAASAQASRPARVPSPATPARANAPAPLVGAAKQTGQESGEPRAKTSPNAKVATNANVNGDDAEKRVAAGTTKKGESAAAAKAESAPPADPVAWDNVMKRALAALASGRSDEALSLYKEAVSIDRTGAAGHRGMALAAARLGRRAEAEKALEEYRKLWPAAPDIDNIAARITAISAD
jgi:serine/threonine protein kinase